MATRSPACTPRRSQRLGHAPRPGARVPGRWCGGCRLRRGATPPRARRGGARHARSGKKSAAAAASSGRSWVSFSGRVRRRTRWLDHAPWRGRLDGVLPHSGGRCVRQFYAQAHGLVDDERWMVRDHRGRPGTAFAGGGHGVAAKIATAPRLTAGSTGGCDAGRGLRPARAVTLLERGMSNPPNNDASLAACRRCCPPARPGLDDVLGGG